MKRLPHTDSKGAAQMVNVGSRDSSVRTATARGEITMAPATFETLRSHDLAKGDALATARIAGIQAAKETARIIPLCHPLPLTHVAVELVLQNDRVQVEARVECEGRTGVEMEALPAASAALLTLYDMAKGIDRAMVISAIRVIDKTGGTRAESYTDPLAVDR